MKHHIETAVVCVLVNEKNIPVCKVEYYEDEENNFYYVFMPIYQNIDTLPPEKFHGIQGIDLKQRKQSYIRKNYLPTFITERAPIVTRTNLDELCREAGIDCYHPLLWLKHTRMQYFGDDYIFTEGDTI